MAPSTRCDRIRGRGAANLGFQIAPESAVFSTAKHDYLATFRHVNCAEYYKPSEVLNPYSMVDPTDCSLSTSVEIVRQFDGSIRPQSQTAMQVCSGRCDEDGGPDDDDDVYGHDNMPQYLFSDEDITAMLVKKARAICRAEHPRLAQVVEIVSTRVLWCEDAPVPAYFSARRRNIAAHSSEVTSGHLALIRARGGIDAIEVDFRTYDYS